MKKDITLKILLCTLQLFALLLAAGKAHAQCGADFYVANDNSGSVSATSDKQARAFIKNLGASLTLGTANTQSRVAVASWANTATWVAYTFPSAGANYTTVQSDLVAYANAPRVLNGGTDPYDALLKTYRDIKKTPVGGRTVPRVIILMTDAFCSQIQGNITTMAKQIKASGVYIMVMAVGPAASCTILQGTNVASPNMYFSAANYNALASGAQASINSMLASVCANTATAWDLSISLTAMNCATGQATYTVSNTGNAALTSQTIGVSFYDGDPSLPATKLLASTTHANQTIAAGGSGSLTYTDAAMIGKSRVWAIVNISTTGSNATPPIPFDISSRLLVAGEGGATNNVSTAFSATGCVATGPVLEVTKTAGQISCDKKVSYNVQVCNTGTVAATNVAVTDYQPAGFDYLGSTVSGGTVTTTPLSKLGAKARATYFGGTSDENLYHGMTTDASGNIYIAGYSSGSTPVTAGAYQTTYGGGTNDGFIAKLSPDGKALLWSTFFGGPGDDQIYGIVIDGSGDLIITGLTTSGSGIASAGAHQTTYGGATDGFIAKFSSAGNRVWSTYYGGAAYDFVNDVDVDNADNIFVGGNTFSTSGIATSGTFVSTSASTTGRNGFAVRFNSAGVRSWGTYMTANSPTLGDGPLALGVKVSGSNVIIGGNAWGGVFGITTAGAWQTTYQGGNLDCFVLSLTASAGTRNWGSMVGGNGDDFFSKLDVDLSGNPYVAASTTSTAGIASGGTAQTTYGGVTDGSLVKLNTTGSARLWGTYYGSASSDGFNDVKISGTDVYAVGYSQGAGLATTGTLQTTLSGTQDGIILRLNSVDGTRKSATYFGGSVSDAVGQCKITASGQLLIAGHTRSTGIATTGAYQTTLGGGGVDDLFVALLGDGSNTISSLAAGSCLTLSYLYDASNVAAATYDNSVGVSTSTASPAYRPNTNFTANNIDGLNGYDGTANTGDEVTIPASTGCVATPQALTAAISVTPTSSCGGGGNYATATVTITNPNTSSSGSGSGITMYNANELLNLSGTGAVFAGEPYNITNGLQIAQADITNANYPASTANTLFTKSGAQNLQLYQVPPGTSTFDIDINMGSATATLTHTVTNILSTFNSTGSTNTASDAISITNTTVPTAAITTAVCGSSTTIATTFINLTGTATNTTGGSVTWSSGTNSTITNTGSLTAPAGIYTINNQDRANGYVDFLLQANTAGGCDASARCRVTITGANYDFGDLPTTYDLSQTGVPYAAAALNPSTTLKLGALNSDAETVANPTANADGDNVAGTNDEDGVASFPAISFATTSYSVTATASNSTGSAATLVGWIDWNNDGQYQPSEASTPVTVPNGTANGSFSVSWASVTPVTGMKGYARFRIANTLTVFDFTGATDGGEVEDYRILSVPLPLDLLEFTAERRNNDGQLNWSTAKERNTGYFLVEHSTDGSHFSPIGEVKATGTSSNEHRYSYTHRNVPAGSHYYRLKMTDNDGRYTHSPVRVLNFGQGQRSILAFPNPAKDQVTVSGLEAGMELSILGVDGRLISSHTAGNNTEVVRLDGLSTGIFLLEVKEAGTVIQHIKLVKQ